MTEDEKRSQRAAEMHKVVEPVKMFDDLFYIGNKGVGIYVVKTSEGLVLIDATDDVDAYTTIVLPSLKKLGLENERILADFITHGHFDHYLGAKGIQEATGCEVGLSLKDSAFMVAGIDNFGKTNAVPQITMLLKDGEDYTFGGHTIRCIYAPGHTPGCLNFSFDVHDGEETHRVAIMGGYGIFGPGFYPEIEWPHSVQRGVINALEFAASCSKFWLYCKETGCDVYLNPHPHLCDLFQCADKNKNRAAGDPNGFVIGVNGVRKWILDRFDACLESAGKFCGIRDEYK